MSKFMKAVLALFVIRNVEVDISGLKKARKQIDEFDKKMEERNKWQQDRIKVLEEHNKIKLKLSTAIYALHGIFPARPLSTYTPDDEKWLKDTPLEERQGRADLGYLPPQMPLYIWRYKKEHGGELPQEIDHHVQYHLREAELHAERCAEGQLNVDSKVSCAVCNSLIAARQVSETSVSKVRQVSVLTF